MHPGWGKHRGAGLGLAVHPEAEFLEANRGQAIAHLLVPLGPGDAMGPAVIGRRDGSEEPPAHPLLGKRRIRQRRGEASRPRSEHRAEREASDHCAHGPDSFTPPGPRSAAEQTDPRRGA